jgi:hypothetical protein
MYFMLLLTACSSSMGQREANLRIIYRTWVARHSSALVPDYYDMNNETRFQISWAMYGT